MKIQLAKSPCWPPYSVVVTDAHGRELWDWDCASSSVEDTLALAAQQYPGEEVIGFDDPRHYSQQGGKR
jgi:hypothetical protein